MLRYLGGALAALVIALGIGVGCSSTPDPEQERAEARDTLRAYLTEISDPPRRDAALGLLDQLDVELDGLRADVGVFRGKVAELSPQKETTREQLLELYDASATARRERQARVLDLHFQLREQLTEAEWPGYAELELALLRANMSQPRAGAAAGVTEEEG